MIQRALARPISCFVAAGTVVALGAVSLARLPVSLLPAIDPPRMDVVVEVPGLDQAEVLRRVTEPVEGRLLAVPGVVAVRSTTGDGRVRFTVDSEWQTDADRLHLDVERRLDALADLPGAQVRTDLSSDDASPVLEIAVFGGRSASARAAWTRRVLVPELARLRGAGRLETIGQRPLHVTVTPLPAALAARGLTVTDLANRLDVIGAPLVAGRVRDGAAVRPLVLEERVESLDELRALRVEGPSGPSLLADLAEVRLAELAGGGRFRSGDRDGTLVRLYRAPRANVVALARAARQRSAELTQRAPAGMTVELVDDRSREVLAAVLELAGGALLGLVLGTLALRWALGSWRATAALAIVVPAAITASFSAFFLWGLSLDVVALGGLALAAGLLVDNSIVVVEAIAVSRERGMAPAQARVAGPREVAVALTSSFVTIAVVFVPMLYLRGLPRAFFGVQGFAIVSTLLLSLAFSLTITPLLGGGSSATGRPIGRAAYARVLAAALAAPRRTLAIALLLAGGGLLIAARLPRQLLPPSAVAQLDARYELPAGLAPEREERMAASLVHRLAAAAPAGRILWVHWPEDAPERRLGEAGTVRMVFPTAEAASKALPSLQAALAGWSSGRGEIAPRPSAVAEAVVQAARGVEVVAVGETPAGAERLARRAEEELGALGIPSRRVKGTAPEPSWSVRWDPWALAGAGVEPEALATQLAAAAAPRQSGRVDLPGVEPDVRIEPAAATSLAALPLRTSEDASSPALPLGAVADLRQEMRPALVERQDGRPVARLVVEPGYARLSELTRQLARVDREGTGELRLGGAAWELRRSFGQLRFALVLSLLLVFLAIAAIYESLSMPLLVMSTVPIATAGAAAALALSRESLNLMSFLGLILLGGLVTNNSIVLLDRAARLRREGLPQRQAIQTAALERYRPIVLTTLTTFAGMLPLALLGGAGVELRRALAVTVIGGVLGALSGSLVVLPVLATWRASRVTGGGAAAADTPAT